MPSNDEAKRYTISQLAKTAGVSIATIKFYLRERLLPQPDLRAAGRAYYSDVHVKRLELLRILREIGELPVADLKQLTLALGKGLPTFEIVAMVVDRLNRTRFDGVRSRSALDEAQREVADFLEQRGLRVRRDSAALRELALALVTLRQVTSPEMQANAFEPYLEHAARLAETEFGMHANNVLGDPENATRNAVIGTVTWERVFSALRRIVHEQMAADLLGSEQQQAPAGKVRAARARSQR